MSQNLPDSWSSEPSSRPDRPEITNKENQSLPRVERIYNHLLWPRHFSITEHDDRYLEAMKLAYNILMAAPTDFEASAMIREVVPGRKLTSAEVTDLKWSTKELFGKMDVRNVDFDRLVMRNQIIDVARRAKLAGDLKNERLAYKDLMNLDRLAVKEHESKAPVVPPLPNVTFTSAVPKKELKEKPELAIIESTPHDEEE